MQVISTSYSHTEAKLQYEHYSISNNIVLRIIHEHGSNVKMQSILVIHQHSTYISEAHDVGCILHVRDNCVLAITIVHVQRVAYCRSALYGTVLY